MIVTFCGHREIAQTTEVEEWLQTVIHCLIEQGATTFYLGGYGAFDGLAASVLRKEKKNHPWIELILVLAYLNGRQDAADYDGSVYPELEKIPRRFAILHRNRWMVQSADVVVAYVLHQTSQTRTFCSLSMGSGLFFIQRSFAKQKGLDSAE